MTSSVYEPCLFTAEVFLGCRLLSCFLLFNFPRSLTNFYRMNYRRPLLYLPWARLPKKVRLNIIPSTNNIFYVRLTTYRPDGNVRARCLPSGSQCKVPDRAFDQNILCRGGGIGRRASFRCWWGQPRAGSSPALGTISMQPRQPRLKSTDYCVRSCVPDPDR